MQRQPKKAKPQSPGESPKRVIYENSAFCETKCFVLAGTINLVVALTIFGVALKAFLNFGGGLAQHCKSML